LCLEYKITNADEAAVDLLTSWLHRWLQQLAAQLNAQLAAQLSALPAAQETAGLAAKTIERSARCTAS
jgi:phage portal protein BeeE